MTTHFDKYKDKGLSGLVNVGNTCYLNSVMQVLSHTYEFNDHLDKLTKINQTREASLLLEWNELRNLLWHSNCIVAPNKFVKRLYSVCKSKNMEWFTDFEQNDSSEFLTFIMDCFHNALSRKVVINISGKVITETDAIALKCFETIKQMYENDYSEILKLFYGMQISQLTNEVTSTKISMNAEPYFILSLPIPKMKCPTLVDCFNLYTQKEIIEDYVDETSKQPIQAAKNIVFWSFPEILVIDVKRFNNQNVKNRAQIDIPLEGLNLQPYVIGNNHQPWIYDLYAVCSHMGTANFGHYTAFIKNANGKWYHFNDNIVSFIDTASCDLKQIISTKAYCYFYRKRPSESS